MKKLYVTILAVLLLSASAWAQVTLRSTTLSAAIDKDQTVFTVASGTGITAGMTAFVDREAMRITSISTATLTVTRGREGTRNNSHASGTTIYVDLNEYFSTYDRSGSCTSTSEVVLPVVNVKTGDIFQCTSSLWVVINGPATTATGLTALGPNAAGTIDVGSLDTAFRTPYFTTDMNFEGATANAIETILRVTDPTVGDSVLTVPDTASVADTFAMVTLAQTLANKTLTTPVIGAATGTSLDLTGTLDVGVAGTTVGSVAMHNATSGTITLQPTTGALGTVAATFPAASITVSGAVGQFCGTTTTCAATDISTTLKVVVGNVALVSASPSTAAITGISPAFTGAGTYSCALSNATTVANTASVLTAGYVSGSAFTITGPNTVTDVIRYVCVGY